MRTKAEIERAGSIFQTAQDGCKVPELNSLQAACLRAHIDTLGWVCGHPDTYTGAYLASCEEALAALALQEKVSLN